MPYSIRLPDGTVVNNIPDDLDPKEARNRIITSMPQYGDTSRTWGEVGSDLLNALGTGSGNLVSSVGKLSSLISGDKSNVLTDIGSQAAQYYSNQDSPGMKARKAQLAQAQEGAKDKGLLEQFTTTLGGIVKDPALLANTVAEQVPSLVALYGISAVAKGISTGLGISEEIATKIASQSAIGAGSIQQGADVGYSTYEQTYDKLLQQGVPESEAKDKALSLARAAGLSGAAIGLLTQKLVPHGADIQKALAGEKLNTNVLKSAFGEAGAQGIGAAGTQFTENLAKRDVDSTQSLTEGVGSSAAMGAIPAGIIGGVTGYTQRQRNAPSVEAPPGIEPTPTEPAKPGLPSSDDLQGMSTEDLMKLKASLVNEPKTRDTKALIKQVTDLTVSRIAQEVEQQRADKTYGEDSPFAQEQPDLFGEFTAREPSVTPEETAQDTATVSDAQRPLDFGQDESGQGTLFGEPSVKAEPDYSQYVSEGAIPLTTNTLDALGIPKKAAVRKRIEGLRLDRSSHLARVADELENYADQYAPNETVRNNVAGFVDNLRQSQAEQKTLQLRQRKDDGQTGTPAGSTEPLRSEAIDSGTGKPSLDLSQGPSQDVSGTGRTQGITEPSSTALGAATEAVRSDRTGAQRIGDALTQESVKKVTQPEDTNVSPTSDSAKLTATADSLYERVADLRAQMKALLDKQGGLPREGTAKADHWNELFQQERDLTGQWAKADEAARKADRQDTAIAAEQSAKDKVATSRKISGVAELGSLDPVADGKKLIDDAVATYNDPKRNADAGSDAVSIVRKKQALDSIRDAADHIANTAIDSSEEPEVRAYARSMFDEHIDPKDVRDKEVANAVKDNINYSQGRENAQQGQPSNIANVIEHAIDNGSTANDVLKIIGDQSSSKFNSYLAKLLAKLPVKPDLAIGNETAGHLATFNEGSNLITIHRRGDSEYAFLHEYVHAATVYAINKGLPMGKFFDQLYNEYKSKAGVIQAQAYGFTNTKEFISEAMSNPKFQRILQDLDTKQNKSFFQAIVDRIRQFLGMTPKDMRALTRIVEALPQAAEENAQVIAEHGTPTYGDEYFSEIHNPALIRQQDELASAAVDTFKPGPARASMQGMKDFLHQGGMLGWRTKVVDSTAAVQHIFGNLTRLASGEINPTRLIAQAMDAGKLTHGVMWHGGIAIDPTSGLSTATGLKYKGENISFRTVLEDLKNHAKRDGVTFNKIEEVLSNILYARREQALADAKADVEFKLTPQQRKQAMDAYNSNPEMQRIVGMLDAIRHNILDYNVTTGVLTEKHAQELKDASAYIPIGRLDEAMELMKTTTGGRGIARLQRLGQYTGSEREIGSVISSYARMMEKLITNGVHNYATRNSMLALEQAGFASRNFDPSYEEKFAKQVVKTKINGNEVSFVTDTPELAAAFVTMPRQVPGLIKALQNFSRVIRAGVTIMPPFALKQVAEDIHRAYTQSGVNNPAALIPQVLTLFPKIFFSKLKNEIHPALATLEKFGTIGPYMSVDSSGTHDILTATGAKKRTIGQAFIHYGEMLAEASDHAVRGAIYQQTMKESGDTLLAETRAREIINFSRRGSAQSVDFANRIIPFFNAYVRGMDKLYTASTGRYNGAGISTQEARSKFWTGMLTLSGMALAYAMYMGDDDDYRQLPDAVRNQNWVLPGWKTIRDAYGFTPVIPLPRELGSIFKVIPDRIVHYSTLQGQPEDEPISEHLKYVLGNFVDAVHPGAGIAAIKPLVENATNYSFLLQRPLESSAQQNLSPFMRYGNSTSEISKVTAEMMDKMGVETSPIKVDNLIRGYTGTAGGVLLTVFDQLINPNRLDRPMGQALGAQITGASTFMKTEFSTQAINELHDLDTKTKQIYNTAEQLFKKNDPRAETFLEGHMKEYSMHEDITKLLKDVNELQKASDEIDNIPDLSKEERQQVMKQLRIEQAELARQVYDIKSVYRSMFGQ